MSPLVPVSKVSRIVAMPLDDDCDEKYIRPSRPFMFCSMIWVTESSTTLADAPGYVARISTEGGATVGYIRSEEHTSELQSLMRISYAVFCLKKKKTHKPDPQLTIQARSCKYKVLIRAQ